MGANSQWEATLHCNVASHWLGEYAKWTLYICNVAQEYCTSAQFALCCVFLACGQATLRTLISVCPSVRHTFWQCSFHRFILQFSGVVTIDRCDVHAKGQGQRSKVKVMKVMTPFSRPRTVTPVWIYIWQLNVAQSLVLLRRGALLFFKVIRQISRSHG